MDNFPSELTELINIENVSSAIDTSLYEIERKNSEELFDLVEVKEMELTGNNLKDQTLHSNSSFFNFASSKKNRKDISSQFKSGHISPMKRLKRLSPNLRMANFKAI